MSKKGAITITTLGVIFTMIGMAGGASFAVYKTTSAGDKEVRSELLNTINPVRNKVIDQGNQISAILTTLNSLDKRMGRLENNIDTLLRLQGVETMSVDEYEEYKDGR